MRFLIDACIGYATEQILKSAEDIQFIFVRDINPKMSDAEIVNLAFKEDCIIITSDKDFGELIFQKHLKNNGVLLLRINELMPNEKAILIQKIIKNFGNQLPKAFSVYKNGTLRIKS